MKLPITYILKELYSPYLLKWANNIGLKGIKLEEYQKKSCEDGINNHKNIEEIIKNKGFKDYKTIGIEIDLDGEFFYGRCDFIAEKNGIKYIFDFKSNDKIYLSHILQLIAYKKLYGDCKIGIINIDSLNEKIILLDKEKEENYFNIFKGLYLILSNKKILGEK